MSYVEWMYWVFMLGVSVDKYKVHASAVCRMMMPCLPEWRDNFQQRASNDNGD